MGDFIIDFLLLALVVIGLTAIIGVLLNGIGRGLLGGADKDLFTLKSASIQSGWRKVDRRK